MTDTVPEWIASWPACFGDGFTHPKVSTPPAIDDGIAAYNAAHPDAYRTGPGEPAGPGGPTQATDVPPWPPASSATPWAYKQWENSLPTGTVVGPPPAAGYAEADLKARAEAQKAKP